MRLLFRLAQEENDLDVHTCEEVTVEDRIKCIGVKWSKYPAHSSEPTNHLNINSSKTFKTDSYRPQTEV